MGDQKTAIELPKHVLAYLSGHETLTLATASATGTPRAAMLKLRPTQVEFIDNTKGDGKKGREQFGVEYHRDLIFNLL